MTAGTLAAGNDFVGVDVVHGGVGAGPAQCAEGVDHGSWCRCYAAESVSDHDHVPAFFQPRQDVQGLAVLRTCYPETTVHEYQGRLWGLHIAATVDVEFQFGIVLRHVGKVGSEVVTAFNFGSPAGSSTQLGLDGGGNTDSKQDSSEPADGTDRHGFPPSGKVAEVYTRQLLDKHRRKSQATILVACMKSEVNRLQGPARDSTFALWRLLQYLAKYGSALLQCGVGHGIGQSQALLAVLPWLCKADKTRLSRNY